MKDFKRGKFEYSKEESIKSGFIELDKITQGFENGNLTIFVSRPAMGKTSFGISLLRNIAIQNEIPVAFFSLEMSTAQLVRRLLSTVSGIESVKIMAYENRDVTLSSEEKNKLNEAEKQLEDAPIYLDDTPSLSVYEFRTQTMRLIREYQIKLIIVDYLQLMNASGMIFNNREEEIGVITRSLKALAKELNIPIIAFSQLYRDVKNDESIEGKRPQLSDLRDSGSIEGDADMICFIHRPDFYGVYQDLKGNDLRGMADIIVAKNRNGKTEDARLKFLGATSCFQNKEE